MSMIRFFLPVTLLVLASCGDPESLTSQSTLPSQGSQRESQSDSVDRFGDTFGDPARPRQPFTGGTELKLSYGLIAKLIRENLKDAIDGFVRKKNCDQVGTSADSRPPSKQYRCGEIPFGEIVDSRKKKVLDIEIERSVGTDNGFDFDIEGKTIHYYLDRVQDAGEIQISVFGGNGRESVSNELAEDIFLRFYPGTSVMQTDLCIAIPGLKTFADRERLTGKLTQDFFLTTLEADVFIDLELGYMEFDAAKACGSVELAIDQFGVPSVKLLSLQSMKYENLRHAGFSVEVTAEATGVLGFINSIAELFGRKIEQEIADQVREKVEERTSRQMDVRKEDIQSGKWAAELIDETLAKEYFVEASKVLKQSFSSLGLGRVESRRFLQALCVTALSGTEYSDLCKLAPQVSSTFFVHSKRLREAGCYTLYMDPNQKSGAWTEDCYLSLRLDVQFEDFVDPLFSCLIDSFNGGGNPITDCRVEVQELGKKYRSGELRKQLEQIENTSFDFDLDKIVELIQEFREVL